MASIRKRGNKYQVQIARKGYKRSGSFASHKAAKEWAKSVEVDIDQSVAIGKKPSWLSDEPDYPTLRDILDKYIQYVVPDKSDGGKEQEIRRIKGIQKRYIADYRLNEIRPQTMADYRDYRLTSVKANTVRLDLATLSHVFNVAIQEWGYDELDNPLAKVRNPQPPPPKERRLTVDEEQALTDACRGSYNPYLLPAFLLSIETALRRRELMLIRWSQIDRNNRVMWLKTGQAKTNEYRAIPLSTRTLAILDSMPRDPGDDRLIQTTYKALVEAWKRARKRSGVKDIRWHDLRHESTSRLFEMGLSMMEAASITGHSNPQMLKRYTHLQPQTLADKLDGNT